MPTKQSLSIALLTISKLFCFFTFRYLSCVSQTMKKLQPFGDVPKKLTEQLRRSFVASRTFAQALLEGKQIVNKISKVSYGNFFQLFFLCVLQSHFHLFFLGKSAHLCFDRMQSPLQFDPQICFLLCESPLAKAAIIMLCEALLFFVLPINECQF